jgi:hypothetical protein
MLHENYVEFPYRLIETIRMRQALGKENSPYALEALAFALIQDSPLKNATKAIESALLADTKNQNKDRGHGSAASEGTGHGAAVSEGTGRGANASEAAPTVTAVVELLFAKGEFTSCEEGLRQALTAGLTPRRKLWELWFTLSVVYLKRTGAETLATMPPSPAGLQDSYAGDLRWCLEQLAREDGTIRISCGGESSTDSKGIPWGNDRFSVGGGAAYKIQLPPGEYTVTLHLAPSEPGGQEEAQPGFSVLLEGVAPLKDMRADEKGRTRRIDNVRVVDGFLDLEGTGGTRVTNGIVALEVTAART